MAGIETELKLSVEPEAIATLLADAAVFPTAPETREQLSTYFDTTAQDLKTAGLSLRVRHIGDRRVQTLKAEGDATASLFARREWERDIAGDTPDLDGTIPLPIAIAADAVAPVFTVAVTRHVTVRDEAGSRVELVIDQGRISAGDRDAPVCEIELELLEGDRCALFALARTLSEHAPLRLGVRSKSERGYALLAGKAPKAIKSEPLRLNDDMDAAALFEAIAMACLRQFRLNEDLLIASGRPEPLHQARVALRRMRSALSIFKDMLAGAELERLRDELRWISGLLGEVRNIDVLIPRIDDGATVALLGEARERGLAELLAALDSHRMRGLVLDLLAWISCGEWRDDEATAVLRATPARLYAHDRLDLLRRRMKTRGRHLARLEEEERHQVRIVGKKLRYAAEFFAALFAGKKAERRRVSFLSHLERLQETLGDLNDLASGRELLRRLGIAEGEALLADGTRKDPKKMLTQAEAAYDGLIDEKRFWR